MDNRLKSSCNIEKDYRSLRIRVDNGDKGYCYIYPGLTYNHTNKLKAQAIIALIEADLEAGLFDKASTRYKAKQERDISLKEDIKLSEAMNRYLEYKKGKVKDRTLVYDRCFFDTFLASLQNKNIKLKTIEAKHIDNFVNTSTNKLSVTKRKLNLLSRLVSWSIYSKLLPDNFTNVFAVYLQGAIVNKRKTEEKRKVLTPQETQYLLTIEDVPCNILCYEFYRIKLLTGLRTGECRGLRWIDIDFENKILQVNHQYSY